MSTSASSYLPRKRMMVVLVVQPNSIGPCHFKLGVDSHFGAGFWLRSTVWLRSTLFATGQHERDAKGYQLQELITTITSFSYV